MRIFSLAALLLVLAGAPARAASIYLSAFSVVGSSLNVIAVNDGTHLSLVGISTAPVLVIPDSLALALAFDPTNVSTPAAIVTNLGATIGFTKSGGLTLKGNGVAMQSNGADVAVGAGGEVQIAASAGLPVTLTGGTGSTIKINADGSIALAAAGGGGTLTMSATGYVAIAAPNGSEIDGGIIHVGLNTVTNTCTGATGCAASCPGGTFLTGGGCSNGTGALVNSFPDSNGWSCGYVSAGTIDAYALCSRLTQ